MAISHRPATRRGSSPAPSPIHAEAIIWNGSHGPTPPVTRARGEKRQRPEDEAETRPEDAPGKDQDEEHQLHAGRSGRQRPQCRGDGGEDSEHGQSLRVHAAVGDRAEHDEDQHGQHQQEDERRIGRVRAS